MTEKTNTAGENNSRGKLRFRRRSPLQNARELGHTTGEEVKILVLHGLLHLRGYDHERDHGHDGAARKSIARALGLPSGLIERSQPPNGRARRKQTQ